MSKQLHRIQRESLSGEVGINSEQSAISGRDLFGKSTNKKNNVKKQKKNKKAIQRGKNQTFLVSSRTRRAKPSPNLWMSST